MKLLIFHMRYHPDTTGTAPLITQLCRDLVQKGVDLTVITSLPHYGRSSIHPEFRDFQGLFHRSQENGVKLLRTRVYLPKSGGIFQRAFNYLSYNVLSILAGFQGEKPDLVLAVNPPITTTFSAWTISLLRRAPLLVGIQDVWPDCVIRVGKLQNRLLIGFSKVLERIQYRVASKIIVLSAGMQSNLESKGVDPAKIEIIANWADTGAVKPSQKVNNFYRQHDLAGKFVVLFSGNHGYIAGLDSVVQAAALLQDREDILFLLVGEGSVKGDIVQLSEELGLKNVSFLSTQPEEAWLEMLAACDVGLVPLRRDLAGLNVPSKVYTLMAAGRPILASVPEEGEVAELVSRAGAGLISKPQDPEDLATKILLLKENPDLMDEYGRNAREYLLDSFNRQRQTEQYYQLLKTTLGEE